MGVHQTTLLVLEAATSVEDEDVVSDVEEVDSVLVLELLDCDVAED